MHWILQNNIFAENGWTTMVETLERFDIPHSVHKVVPFVGELIPEPELAHPNVICMGTYSMRHVARRNGWQPGVFDLIEQDFEKQKAHWGAHLLNFGSVVTPFRDAAFTDERMFVRPANDMKHFAGRIFEREEFLDWQRRVCELNLDDSGSLTPDTMIQLAVPTVIHAEYRYWIVKGKIVTRSLYKRGDQVFYSDDVDERLDRYVEDRVAEWSPHETFVIDVCDTPDGIRIVEINTLNASGFYAADVQKLVLSLEEAYELTQDP